MHSDVSQYFLYRMPDGNSSNLATVFGMPLPNVGNDSRRKRDLRVSIRFYSATSFINGWNWVI